jgi:putative endonuclease
LVIARRYDEAIYFEFKKMKPGFVYIITNYTNTTLYVGVTSDLHDRVKQHQNKVFENSFSARYNLNKLVYFEAFQMIGDAIAREKQIKAGSRAKKVELIKTMNPEWKDLYFEIEQYL